MNRQDSLDRLYFNEDATVYEHVEAERFFANEFFVADENGSLGLRCETLDF